MTGRDWRYLAGLVCVGILAVYAGYWIGTETLVRLMSIQPELFGVDVALAVQQESLAQVIAFYCGAGLVVIAFIFLIFRHPWALRLYAAALPPIFIDWFMMNDIAAFGDFLIAYPVLIGYFVGLTPLYAMWRLGDFRPENTPSTVSQR